MVAITARFSSLAPTRKIRYQRPPVLNINPTGSLHATARGLLRTPLPRTPVNKGFGPFPEPATSSAPG